MTITLGATIVICITIIAITAINAYSNINKK